MGSASFLTLGNAGAIFQRDTAHAIKVPMEIHELVKPTDSTYAVAPPPLVGASQSPSCWLLRYSMARCSKKQGYIHLRGE